jgi:hypothetical protein
MKGLSSPARRRRRVAIDAAMVFLIVLLMTQMWLLTATLESYLAGHKEAALPAALVSAVLFGICFAIYRLVVSLDKLPEQTSESRDAGPWRIG